MFFSCAPDPEVSRRRPLANKSFDLNGASGSVMDPGANEKLVSLPVGQNWSASVPLPVKIKSSRRGKVELCAAASRLKYGKNGAAAALNPIACRKFRRRMLLMDDAPDPIFSPTIARSASDIGIRRS